MRIRLPVLFLLLAFMCPANAGESRQIAGRVLDEKGNPVKDAAIDFFWRANGSDKDQNGKPEKTQTNQHSDRAKK